MVSVVRMSQVESPSCTITENEFVDEVRRHLSKAQLAWALRKDHCDLLIPGHSPIPIPETADRIASLRTGGVLPFYEEVTTLLLAYLVDRFRISLFYDVGAGDGYFSKVAVSFGGAPIRAHAFEMRPDAVNRLHAHAERDPLFRTIDVHHVGVTSEHGGSRDVWYARTHMFERKPERHEHREGIGRSLRLAIWPDPTRTLKRARIELTSIDAFCQASQTMPDIIKIDVEGYESAVLAGAYVTLSRCRPFILLELHKDKKLRFGLTRREVVDLVLRKGYRAVFLTDHEDRRRCDVIPVNRDHPLVGRQETDLLLFYHPQRLQTFRTRRQEPKQGPE